MNTMPFISVIIPAYKAAKYIEETVRSVLNQTYSHFELIIVDDGSPDDQDQIIEKLCKEDSRIRYVKQENGGVSSARNHGFQLSTGSYIAFLDADDVWLPDNLASKVEFLNQNQHIGLVHSDLEQIDEKSERNGQVMSGKSGWLLNDLLAWQSSCIPAPSSCVIRRSCLENVGVFDTQLSNNADQELWIRLAKEYEIGRIKRVTWLYRIHAQNMHSNISLMESDTLYTFQKAKKAGNFKSKSFERACFANMYLILGASWWGDGKNKWKACQYALKALATSPTTCIQYYRKRNELN